MDRTLLLSYPRSGNTWLRYCVEILTNKKTVGALRKEHKNTISEMDKNSLTKTNDNVILEKAHNFLSGDEKIFNNMILLLRNYKEAIPRHKPNDVKKGVEHYNNILKSYSNFKNNKMVIYYEDLILKPKETLKSVLIFLNDHDNIKLDSFMENYDKHRIRSLTIYDKYQSRGNKTYLKNNGSRSNDITFHQKRLSKDGNFNKKFKLMDDNIVNELTQRYKIKND